MKRSRFTEEQIIGTAEREPTFSVFASNVSSIGKLGKDVAADVITFYALLDGINVDIRAAARGELDIMALEKRIALVEQDLGLWGEAKDLGESLMQRL